MSQLNSPWLISIAAGNQQVPGIQAAQKVGIRVFALDGSPDAPGLKLSDDHAVVDITNPNAVLEAIRAKQIQPKGVVSFVSEAGLESVIAIREEYQLSGPNRNQTYQQFQKALQRKCWQEKGLPQPKWNVVSSEEEANHIFNSFSLPMVVKPIDSSASRGVSVVRNRSEWPTALKKAQQRSLSKTLLLEDFIDGVEYSIESFSSQGIHHVLAISQRVRWHDVTAHEIFTVDLPSDTINQIQELTSKALDALEHQEGPAHTELIISSSGEIFLLETAARGGGDMVFNGIVPAVSQYDIATATAMQAVGFKIPKIPKSNSLVSRYALLRFLPTQAGVIQEITGYAEANQVPGVKAASFTTVGDILKPVECDEDRLGYVLAIGSSMEDVRKKADLATQKIHYQITPHRHST